MNGMTWSQACLKVAITRAPPALGPRAAAPEPQGRRPRRRQGRPTTGWRPTRSRFGPRSTAPAGIRRLGDEPSGEVPSSLRLTAHIAMRPVMAEVRAPGPAGCRFFRWSLGSQAVRSASSATERGPSGLPSPYRAPLRGPPRAQTSSQAASTLGVAAGGNESLPTMASRLRSPPGERNRAWRPRRENWVTGRSRSRPGEPGRGKRGPHRGG